MFIFFVYKKLWLFVTDKQYKSDFNKIVDNCKRLAR